MSERSEYILDAIDLRGAVIGRISGQDERGRPLVAWPGWEGAPRWAEVVFRADPVDWRACSGARALLALAEGPEGMVPVLVGLLDPPRTLDGPLPSAPGDTLRVPGAVADPAASAVAPADPAASRSPAPQDLHVEAGREIVLQCGEASIALRADGRIVIRGGYILSRSTGAHKIKGATVQIN